MIDKTCLIAKRFLDQKQCNLDFNNLDISHDLNIGQCCHLFPFQFVLVYRKSNAVMHLPKKVNVVKIYKMDNKNCYILLLLLNSVSVYSLKTKNFEKTKIKAISMPVYDIMASRPQMNQIDCAYYCMKNEDCDTFRLTKEGSCLKIPNIGQNLLKAHYKDPKAVTLQTTENVDFGLHFLLMYDGKIEDFSVSEGEAIYTFPGLPSPAIFGYINNGDGSIYILNDLKMYLFSFEAEEPQEIPELTLPATAVLDGYATFTTQNGIGFIRVQYEIWIFINGNWKQGAKFPYPDNGNSFELACATFIPGNDNDVYHTGGYASGAGDLNVMYRYSIKDDIWEQLPNLPATNRRHACTGYVKDNKEYIAIAGGQDGNKPEFRFYSIEDQTWGLFPPLVRLAINACSLQIDR